MSTKTDKKNEIRQGIIDSALIYSKKLAGRHFLYVYGNEYFEVSFPVNHFSHLTGVGSGLASRSFYKHAKQAKLTTNQFFFDSRHPYSIARRKMDCLKRLQESTTSPVCILKGMKTLTITYDLSITNLEFTLGLTENIDRDGKKKDEYYLPMTLRMEENSVERSDGGEVVDFIFSKDASRSLYDTMLVADSRKEIPDCLKNNLAEEMIRPQI